MTALSAQELLHTVRNITHDGSPGAAYVQDWIKALEDDPKEIYKAAADAQKVSDYLMRPIREREHATAPCPTQICPNGTLTATPTRPGAASNT